ncbi:MAG: hypothetical protein U0802_13375 [Candidatus Binatia bacterium]
MHNPMTRLTAVAAAAVLFLLLASAPAALANLPLGACCLANRTCQDLMVTQCDDQGGDFIGEGTSCAQIDCGAPVAVPLLSLSGLVAAAGALTALGLYRLTIGRRRGR